MKQLKVGAAMASALAFAFASGQAVADDHSSDAGEKVKCLGGNSCKAQGQCATDHHACAGQNGCAGQGWVLLTKGECQKIPGAEVAE